PFDSLLGLDPADADRLLEHERPAVVRHRRAERASGREEASADGVPSDLVGLAISGGGIRSATFAQGVLGRLAREDLLPEFDYLSTVSGGGYFGSFLSSYWCAEDPAVGPGSRQLPFHEDGQPEPRPLRYIRNRSKVLLDGGLIGLARALWPLFYGVLVNVLVLTPLALFLLGLLLLVPKLAEDADQVRGMLNRAQALFAWIGALLVLLLPLTHRSLKARRVSQHEFLALAAGGLVALLWLLDQATVWVFPRLEVWQGDLERFIGHHPWAFPMILLIAFTHFIFGNINWSSLHGYYRRRLASAFILRRGREGEEAVEPRESQELRLSDLGERGPYHLINAAVNLPTCGGIDLRGRKSDFFLLSRFFCGSPSLGYCRTDQLEKRDPELDLGTAMAISGAAASPHMGVKELRGLSFWLALFNIRLSYWIPNPKELQSGWHRLR
ncbi:MAG: patatin-like phospholipase family protein, partial [Acidobacteriota bacterium]